MIKYFVIISFIIAISKYDQIWKLRYAESVNATTVIGSSILDVPALELADVLQLLQMRKGLFIDVRNRANYNKEHIKGAYWVDTSQISAMPEGIISIIKNYDVVIIYCETNSCQSQYSAGVAFQSLGFENNYIYTGGFLEWKACGLPVESQ